MIKRFFHYNGLSLVLGLFFAVFWVGQAIVGRLDYNEDRADRGLSQLGFVEYLQSTHFLEATMENWESEFLQMSAYVFLTAYLFQKGSSESKDPDGENPQDEDPRMRRDKPDAPWPVRRGGWVLKLYENSLGLTFLLLFSGAMALHALGGKRLYNEEQAALGKDAVTYLEYLGTSRFWFESLQNWQSEFLAMFCMVVLSIYLRQRGSPESKAVAASHAETGDQD